MNVTNTTTTNFIDPTSYGTLGIVIFLCIGVLFVTFLVLCVVVLGVPAFCLAAKSNLTVDRSEISTPSEEGTDDDR